MRSMTKRPDRLRVESPARAVGVDREKRVLRGYVVAQLGPFKSEGRGEFDETSLARIVELWPAAGLKSRFAHPTESADGLGKYLGRARDPYLSTVEVDGATLPAVRADLHLDSSASKTPSGDLAGYVLDLAESDPAALSSSLVLGKDEEYRLSPDGTRLTGADGNPLPPLWRPKRLYASDVVDEGDAVDAILSPEGAPRYARDFLSMGTALIDRLFAGCTRAVVRARCMAYLTRYLDRRFGPMQNRDMLGPRLGQVLDDYIEAGASDERPREVIISQMAEAAAITVEEVSAIITGQDVPVTAAVLEAFAAVLGCPLSELVAAAEEDGIDFAAGEEPPADAPPADAPAPAPPADAPAPMSAKPGLLRRRLKLQEQGVRFRR